MISLMLLQGVSFTVTEAASTSISKSIEMNDAEGLLKALNSEKPKRKELNLYISIAEKKYDSLQSKLRFWRVAKYLAVIGVPLGTIIGLATGGAVGVLKGWEAVAKDTGNFTSDVTFALLGAGVGGAVGAPAGAGVGLATSAAALAFVNRQVANYEKKAEKAHAIVLILRDALQRRKK